jgi:hypothetical protein
LREATSVAKRAQSKARFNARDFDKDGGLGRQGQWLEGMRFSAQFS